MSLPRTGLALAFALVASAASGCGSKDTGGAGGGMGGGATAACGLGTGGDPTVSQCGSCLDMACATQKAACGPDCYAVQACIDATCAHLSMIMAPMEEGMCQTYCQSLHPAGKQPHLDYVNCAQGASCSSHGCAGAPYDYDQCVAQQLTKCCKPASDACAASSDCTTYQACIAVCTTFADCQKCAMGTSGANGQKLLETVTLCTAQTCLAEEWLPNL